MIITKYMQMHKQTMHPTNVDYIRPMATAFHQSRLQSTSDQWQLHLNPFHVESCQFTPCHTTNKTPTTHNDNCNMHMQKHTKCNMHMLNGEYDHLQGLPFFSCSPSEYGPTSEHDSRFPPGRPPTTWKDLRLDDRL